MPWFDFSDDLTEGKDMSTIHWELMSKLDGHAKQAMSPPEFFSPICTPKDWKIQKKNQAYHYSNVGGDDPVVSDGVDFYTQRPSHYESDKPQIKTPVDPGKDVSQHIAPTAEVLEPAYTTYYPSDQKPIGEVSYGDNQPLIKAADFAQDTGKKYSNTISDGEKEAIIEMALGTDEGRKALAQAMVEPIRNKMLMGGDPPQGALPRYERDVKLAAHAQGNQDYAGDRPQIQPVIDPTLTQRIQSLFTLDKKVKEAESMGPKAELGYIGTVKMEQPRYGSNAALIHETALQSAVQKKAEADVRSSGIEWGTENQSKQVSAKNVQPRKVNASDLPQIKPEPRVLLLGEKDRPASAQDIADLQEQLAKVSLDPNLTIGGSSCHRVPPAWAVTKEGSSGYKMNTIRPKTKKVKRRG
jgi:hypothetical protein